MGFFRPQGGWRLRPPAGSFKNLFKARLPLRLLRSQPKRILALCYTLEASLLQTPDDPFPVPPPGKSLNSRFCIDRLPLEYLV